MRVRTIPRRRPRAAGCREVHRLTCPICGIRKEKRFCLAMHERICPQCCGEQREVTLDCPSECPYLQQARQHEKPPEIGGAPPAEVFPEIALRDDFLLQHEQLMGGLFQTLARLSRADRSLRDRDLIGALANMAKSRQTLVASGLVYQEALPNPVQQQVIAALEELFQEFQRVEAQHRGYTTLKDRDVLNALVFTLRLIHLHSSGRPLSRGFIDFLQGQFADAGMAVEGTSEGGSRIILP